MGKSHISFIIFPVCFVCVACPFIHRTIWIVWIVRIKGFAFLCTVRSSSVAVAFNLQMNVFTMAWWDSTRMRVLVWIHNTINGMHLNVFVIVTTVIELKRFVCLLTNFAEMLNGFFAFNYKCWEIVSKINLNYGSGQWSAGDSAYFVYVPIVFELFRKLRWNWRWPVEFHYSWQNPEIFVHWGNNFFFITM